MTAVTGSKAIVAVVAVASRGASQVEHPTVNVGANRNVSLAHRVNGKSKKRLRSRCRRVNRRKSRPQLACGTRFLAHLLSRSPRLLTNQRMRSARRRTCEMSLGRPAAVFLMHIPTSRCKCSTRVTKRIVPANQEIRR